jgi:hypothetical protein
VIIRLLGDNFGQFFEDYRSNPKFLGYYIHGYGSALILPKMGWA